MFVTSIKNNRWVLRTSKDLMNDGAYIANILNFAATEPSLQTTSENIAQVATQLTAMTKDVSRRFSAIGGPKISAKERARIRAEDEEKLNRFNALLLPHTWSLELVGWNNNNKGGRAVPVFVDMPNLASNATYMSMLIQLARAGLLDRLRKCAGCGKWFFARKPWGEFCSTACRKEKFRSTPEYQQENREFQRDYFRKKLSVNQKYYQKGLSPSEIRELRKKRKKRRKA
jgi:hypothetical protein